MSYNKNFSNFNYLGLKVGEGKTWYCESHTAGRTLLSISNLVALVVVGVADCETFGFEGSISWMDWSFGRARSFPLAASTEAGLNCSWYDEADASSLFTCSNGVLMSRCGFFFSGVARSFFWKVLIWYIFQLDRLSTN